MVARDRIELSTLRFSVYEKEATRGSRKPLPPFLLGFLHARDYLNQPPTATDCHPFVTRVLHAAKLSFHYCYSRDFQYPGRRRACATATIRMRRASTR